MREYSHSIYILLTRTSSLMSRLVRFFTRAVYTHAALALDDEFEETYSFTRRNPHLILPAGLARENLWRGLYFSRHDPPCRVYRLRLSAEEYERISGRVRAMYAERGRYHYNFLGVAANFFGHQYSSPRRYFCSEFVASLVAMRETGGEICPAGTRPMDLIDLPGAECVYEGTVGGLRDRIEDCRAFRMKVWEEDEESYSLIVYRENKKME